MRLSHAANSPFVRKIMVVLHETGLLDAVTLVPASGSPLDPGSIPLDGNPLGKVPFLALDDGTPLYDSRVICRYLDARGDGGLYPPEPALWAVLVMEALGDGMSDAAVAVAYETRLRPEALRFANWMEGQWTKVDRALDALEADAVSLSAPLHMGQIAVGAALGYIDLRHAARDWRRDRSRLAAWEAAFAQRPSMQATLPPG